MRASRVNNIDIRASRVMHIDMRASRVMHIDMLAKLNNRYRYARFARRFARKQYRYSEPVLTGTGINRNRY